MRFFENHGYKKIKKITAVPVLPIVANRRTLIGYLFSKNLLIFGYEAF